jgi:hypothetical protein
MICLERVWVNSKSGLRSVTKDHCERREAAPGLQCVEFQVDGFQLAPNAAKVRVDSLVMCLTATVIRIRVHVDPRYQSTRCRRLRSCLLFGNYLNWSNNIA